MNKLYHRKYSLRPDHTMSPSWCGSHHYATAIRSSSRHLAAVAARAEELEVLKSIRPAPGAREHVIDIHNAKWEMGLTTCADNFLLAIQAVSVGLGRFCISARTGGSFSALTDLDNGPRSSAMRSLTSLIANSERSMPTHWRCTRSEVTKAVAHPRKWSRIRSPKLLDTLMMRYKSAIGFALDRPFPFVSAHHDSGTFPGWSGVLAWPEPNGPFL